MAGAVLALVFLGWFFGRDPSQLTGVVGLVFTAFAVADSLNDYTYRKFTNGTNDNSGSGNDGG